MTEEVIIVGSGPSGVGAALGFTEQGVSPLVLDAGHEPGAEKPVQENLYEYRKSHDAFDLMIGEDYQVIHHVLNKRTPSPKISSPYMQFVTRDAEKISPIEESGFSIIQSFSQGGLANAWGAALYRCMDDELVDMPITADELAPYYDRLTEEIGISGDDDDLTRFFGSTKHLLKPLKLSKKSEKIYATYMKKRGKLNAQGIYFGRSRVGVLSQELNGREACSYQNMEMWAPNLPYIYTPAFTLRKLIKDKKVNYRKAVVVKSWSRKGDHIVVHARELDGGEDISFTCRKLVLAAGAINSTKIVLNTKKDYSTKLPLLDNTLFQIPLVLPSFIGSALDKEAFALTNLNVLFDDRQNGQKIQGSLIELTSPARAAFFDMLPLSASDNLRFIKLFLPALMVLFLYFPGTGRSGSYMRLQPDGRLRTHCEAESVDRSIIRKVIRALLSLGVLTHASLVKAPDHSIHYGGTVPMAEHPEGEYQCNTYGELNNERGVYLADGSLLSYIPSKNYSLTLMANAMRIAEHISREIKRC